MARKTVADLKSNVVDQLTKDAVDDFKSVSEIKYELAKEAYDLQDEPTRLAIDRIMETLQVYATGSITVQLSPPRGALVPVRIDNTYLGYNLLWLAVEICKDLAFLDLQVANFKFPPSQCLKCGAEIIPEKRKIKRG